MLTWFTDGESLQRTVVPSPPRALLGHPTTWPGLSWSFGPSHPWTRLQASLDWVSASGSTQPPDLVCPGLIRTRDGEGPEGAEKSGSPAPSLSTSDAPPLPTPVAPPYLPPRGPPLVLVGRGGRQIHQFHSPTAPRRGSRFRSAQLPPKSRTHLRLSLPTEVPPPLRPHL